MTDILSFNYRGSKLSIVFGDITEESSEVIVSATNTSLTLRAGVAEAIRNKGGMYNL